MDDSTTIQIAPSPNTPSKDATKISQEGLDLFSGSAQATGGQVSAKKTKWYLLEFKWDKAGKIWLADHEAELFFRLPWDHTK